MTLLRSQPPGARAAHELLRQAVAARRFPAAALEVGNSDGAMWQEALGALSFDAGAPPAQIDTIFDLASLTKPLVTTTAVLDLVARDRLRLSDPVADSVSQWRGRDRESVTIEDLLEHAAGLPARLSGVVPTGRGEMELAICATPLVYAPRAQSVYSDLGFILLGFLAADRSGEPLDALFARRIAAASTDRDREALATLTFGVPNGLRANTAPTLPLPGDPRGGGRLSGEVHDDYAAALNGVAGHAGLFGTAPGVGSLARQILAAARGVERAPAFLSAPLVARAVRRSSVPGSSRGLGWDTMLPTSSCGTKMSPRAFGHVGFTGTSLWIDPAMDRYYVLLTNRACGGGSLEDMREVRRGFHESLAGL